MKKTILKLVLVAGLLVSNASAWSVEKHSYLGVSAKSGTISIGNDYKERLYGLKWGVYSIFNSGLLLGVDFEGDYGKSKDMDNSKVAYFDANIHLGYRVLSKYKVDVYAIGSAKKGTIENLDMYGFGYGVGIAKNLWNFGRLTIEYKKYSLTAKGGLDVDESNIGGGIVFFLR
ncbi:hypothetical protein FE773_08985 [Caminibacter mediatlanticus TB-2]|uniref:Outer membrane protein beta-barrel domain-containing protein n=1 Tax=Caminibacter mediatlanticus TB-2 TaxID=391592 RepID=A0ABX5VEE4_9BACT|nr:outer membrane beta-barrel protein [Caminibacter mediatlanticus]QCT95321.1 hypothetical protein FE773_08985 [Caminibacter mediatlanticus TB-2]